ncbi:MAG TPA: type II and III secretion system protein family protein [Janthinobacterium sp.]|nr:type II and III secretion system protein family protein [Janthinobacterium sp.]
MKNNSYHAICCLALAIGGQALAADVAVQKVRPGAAGAMKPCASVGVELSNFVTLGKSSVIRLGAPVVRLVVGGFGAGRAGKPQEAGDKMMPGAAAPQAAAPDSVADVDIALLSPTELFFLGKKTGSMNVVLQDREGRCFVRDIVVTVDPATLQAKLAELMPEETGIRVKAAENALILTGRVSDSLHLDDALSLAASYGDGKRVVNLLRINTPQQVMLEVKIAEVSKTLLDRFGIDYTRMLTSADGLTSRILSGIFGGGSAVFGEFGPNLAAGLAGSASGAITGGTATAGAALSTVTRGATLIGIDAQNKDGLVRVLAEPNIMSISGQQASFLSGGKIFIPVAQSRDGGGTTITLEEKEFGVGLKFLPTVLDGSRVNLKLVSEVSELSQTGSPFTTVGGVTSVLPSISTRRVDTTVQLNDGQSFAIAGLIRNNITETIKRFPGLGDLPLLGALFRSSEFQKEQTELIFVVTPRLVKPLAAAPALPTDYHPEPTRADVILRGMAEGRARDSAPVPVTSNSNPVTSNSN